MPYASLLSIMFVWVLPFTGRLSVLHVLISFEACWIHQKVFWHVNHFSVFGPTAKHCGFESSSCVLNWRNWSQITKNLSVINNCQTRSTPYPNKNFGFPHHEGPTLLKRLWCNYGLRAVYWSSLEFCTSNNIFMSLNYKSVISNCHIRYTENPKYDSWPSFSTRPCVVSRAEA